MDYIKNYIRPIPEDVIEKKRKADKLMVFDNYCILYYDPENNAISPTVAEKMEDPILFGMIQGSTNLYYIADWIDEYCDLTLDRFIELSGIKEVDTEIELSIEL